MEEYDELLQQPDDRGVLDMSHRAWRIIDDSVWGWHEKLITLNVSFNDLPAIPKEIGLCSLLQWVHRSGLHRSWCAPRLTTPCCAGS